MVLSLETNLSKGGISFDEINDRRGLKGKS